MKERMIDMSKNKKKEKPLPQAEQGKTGAEQAKRKQRFSRLYIVTAISTAVVCFTIVLISAQVSRSVTRRLEKTPMILPSPMPVDSLLKPLEEKAEKTETASPVPTEAARKKEDASATKEIEAASAETTLEDSVAVGLFPKREPFQLILPCGGEVLNPFSENRLKKSKTLGDWRTHNGMDLKADIGTAVNAAADGTVMRAEYDSMTGYTVVVEHREQYQTVYANLASAEMVELGQNIRAGECLGAVGDSAVFEKLEESHLHFELIKDGSYQNPLDYVR